MIVKVKRLRADAVIPEYATPGAAGVDLVAAETVIIGPGETKLIPTGLAFEIPWGYELQIRMRSGIAKRTHLRLPNSVGTIDSDYRGEVFMMFENCKNPYNSPHQMPYSRFMLWDIKGEARHHTKFGVDAPEMPGCYIIRKGDRIAQGVIAPVMRAVFEETDDLSETDRGSGGFGSTGVRG